MGRKKVVQRKSPVSQEMVDRCIAKTVFEGDIVNFRFLFFAYSPLREESTEDIDNVKYAYLVPQDDEGDEGGRYQEALRLASEPAIREHIKEQLSSEGPAQLPWELICLLADNAVRLGKYSAAGQAYELLRIRRSMQEEFFRQGDEALDKDEVARGVLAYRIGVGLAYDYAAFPEPLPSVANHQTEALLLHAVYPTDPADALALQPTEKHVDLALEYLLDREAAGRLSSRPLEERLAFLDVLIRAMDSQWDDFTGRYHEAITLTDAVRGALERANDPAGKGLEEELKGEVDEEEFWKIPECMLGRAIGAAEWWQYVKELAYEHPAAILFIKRQVVSEGLEIVIPILPASSPLAQRLGLASNDA